MTSGALAPETVEAVASTWPLWRRPTDEEDHQGDVEAHAELTRYVSSDALRGFDYQEPEPASGPALAAELYDMLARERWTYVDEPGWPGPLASRVPQQIRAPRDVRRSGSATCLDVAVLLGSLAVRANARPILAVGKEHAMVLVSRGSGAQLTATKTHRTGVWRVDDKTVAEVNAGELIPVDVARALTTTARPEPDAFADAVASGQRYLRDELARGRRVLLVDVVFLAQYVGEPHVPDQDLTFIPSSLPAGAGRHGLYKNQIEACETLRGKRGVVVLHGQSGSGKTTAALHLAAQRDAGPSLVLDASAGDSVMVSLADVACRELGLRAERLDRLDRLGYADMLLGRLRSTNRPWCVVFDNADGDPSDVLGRLPRPRPGADQLVIVTTTHPAWLAVGLVDEHVRFTSMDEDETAAILGPHAAFAKLVDGRAVTLRAVQAYLKQGGDPDRLRRASAAYADAGELRGAAGLVDAILEQDEALRSTLQRLALLPPGHLPVGGDVGDRDLFERLDALGLVEVMRHSGTAQMHRLVGRGIERALGDEGAPAAAAANVLGADSFRALSAAADPALLKRLSDLVLTATSPSGAFSSEVAGQALGRGAALLELRGQIGLSRTLAERAVAALDAPDGKASIELVDALQSLARYANQHQQQDAEALEDALKLMAKAQRVAGHHRDERRAARARRLEALLRVKVGKLIDDPDESAEAIRSALRDLRAEADAAAVSVEAIDQAEIQRAKFNVAGPLIELAQIHTENADMYLNEAWQVYDAVAQARVKLYRESQHPHVAACISGKAMADYFRALLVEVSYDGRQRLLQQATGHETQALTDRFALEGPSGGEDTAKSSRLLTKIAYARHLLNQIVTEPAAPALVEARREAVLPVLTAASDRDRYVTRWVRSPALAGLLTLLGAPSLDASMTVGESLRHLEQHSREWATRDDRFGGLESRTILSAARSLGLMDTDWPDRRVYDHVVVMGDGAAGPRLVAAAVRDGRLSAGRVVDLSDAEGAIGWEGVEAAASRLGFQPDAQVLVVTEHARRVEYLAAWRRSLPACRIEAMGIAPGAVDKALAQKVTPADHLRHLRATICSLQAWWDAA